MPRRLHDFIRKFSPPLFQDLSFDLIDAVLAGSKIEEFDAHKTLVQQGDQVSMIYMVISGTMKTIRIDQDGNEAIMRLLRVGGTCLDAVLFMGGPSPITVQTIAKSRVLIIPEAVIQSQIQKDPQLAINLLRIISYHYKNAMQQIDAINIKTPLQRIGYYFLTKYLEDGSNTESFSFPFNKQTIANYLGMTPETFSRTLKQLKDIGSTIEDEHIRLDNVFSLCQFCDSDTAALCKNRRHKDCHFDEMRA